MEHIRENVKGGLSLDLASKVIPSTLSNTANKGRVRLVLQNTDARFWPTRIRGSLYRMRQKPRTWREFILTLKSQTGPCSALPVFSVLCKCRLRKLTRLKKRVSKSSPSEIRIDATPSWAVFYRMIDFLVLFVAEAMWRRTDLRVVLVSSWKICILPFLHVVQCQWASDSQQTRELSSAVWRGWGVYQNFMQA